MEDCAITTRWIKSVLLVSYTTHFQLHTQHREIGRVPKYGRTTLSQGRPRSLFVSDCLICINYLISTEVNKSCSFYVITLQSLSFEWNSIRLGGPAHGIVTKTIHKTLPGGGRGQGARGGWVAWWGSRGWWGSRDGGGPRGWWGCRGWWGQGGGGGLGVVGV